jgi:co-chaperonin GroES (HSP10)
MIKPINGCLFLELKGQYNNIQASSEKYGNTKNRGIVIDIANDIRVSKLRGVPLLPAGLKVGSIVYFNQYEDQSAFKRDGKDYAFIKFEDIRGVEDATE